MEEMYKQNKKEKLSLKEINIHKCGSNL